MHRCLVIDRSPLIRKVARVILSDFGYAVSDAETGREGLAQFRRLAPRLVIIDAGLADMNALDVLRQIRDMGVPQVHVLYCTTDYDVLGLQQAQAAGAKDVLIKPFDRASLATKLDARAGGDVRGTRPNFYSRLARSEIVRLA